MTPEEIKRIKELSKSKIMKQVSLEDTIKKAMEADALIPTKPKRKTLTKLEKDLLELERMLNYDNLEKEEILEPIQEEEKEWDVTINDKIEYFDPALSYELTGYRPITKELGLDFNPKLFTEAADRYRKNGKYTNYIPGTFIHRNYWLLEFKKCLNGYKIGRYRLTGQHYFFLNYYRLLSVLSDKEGPGKRKEDFPVFIAKQYEYFHYLEMCLILGNDGLAFKSRGVDTCAPLK